MKVYCIGMPGLELGTIYRLMKRGVTGTGLSWAC